MEKMTKNEEMTKKKAQQTSRQGLFEDRYSFFTLRVCVYASNRTPEGRQPPGIIPARIHTRFIFLSFACLYTPIIPMFTFTHSRARASLPPPHLFSPLSSLRVFFPPAPLRSAVVSRRPFPTTCGFVHYSYTRCRLVLLFIGSCVCIERGPDATAPIFALLSPDQPNPARPMRSPSLPRQHGRR